MKDVLKLIQSRRVPSWQYALDRTGVLASGLCAIHCVALPFLLSASIFSSWTFLRDEKLENIFLISSALIAVCSLVPSCITHHKRSMPLVILVCGLVSIVISRFMVDTGEVAFASLGASLVATAHFLNYRYCKNCK
jgi:MerC mercury resistance protein